MISEGVIYVAYGWKARNEARQSMESLGPHCARPVTIIADKKMSRGVTIPEKFSDPFQQAHWAKTNLNLLSPYRHTLYLDADTRVKGDITVGFRILDDGWDLVVVPSAPPLGDMVLWNLSTKEKLYTIDALLNPRPLMLNTGVMFFGTSKRIVEFFEVWRTEWLKFKAQDQGAFLRALDKSPLRIWLLGYAFNTGELVEHHFGKARA